MRTSFSVTLYPTWGSQYVVLPIANPLSYIVKEKKRWDIGNGVFDDPFIITQKCYTDVYCDIKNSAYIFLLIFSVRSLNWSHIRETQLFLKSHSHHMGTAKLLLNSSLENNET